MSSCFGLQPPSVVLGEGGGCPFSSCDRCRSQDLNVWVMPHQQKCLGPWTARCCQDVQARMTLLFTRCDLQGLKPISSLCPSPEMSYRPPALQQPSFQTRPHMTQAELQLTERMAGSVVFCSWGTLNPKPPKP